MKPETAHIHKAIDQSSSITEQKTSIEKHEKKAAEAAAARDRAVAELRSAQAEWKRLLEKFEELISRAGGAKHALKFAQERTTERKQKFLGFLGMPGSSNLQFLAFATELNSESAALALIEEGVRRAKEDLESHRAKILDYGRSRGVDEGTLEILATATAGAPLPNGFYQLETKLEAA